MRNSRCLVPALVASVLIAEPAFAGSPAADVGGLWTGTVTCSFSKNGTKLKRAFDALTLRITQTSSNVAAVVDYGG